MRTELSGSLAIHMDAYIHAHESLRICHAKETPGLTALQRTYINKSMHFYGKKKMHVKAIVTGTKLNMF